MQRALSPAAKDIAGGLLIAAIGAGAALQGRSYSLGSLTRMGPGFLPVVLGLVLTALGVALSLSGLRRRAPAQAETPAAGAPVDWRGVCCIALGMAAFIALVAVAGFIPAAFTCVFIAALGDRSATIHSAVALGIGLTVAGTLLFHYGLGIRMPLLRF